jgi:membrane-bound serine protease (ClpP class)
MPGTGIVEILAIGTVIASLAILAGMPTNWFAVLLIVVGVLGFLIVPLIDRRFALVAAAGLILQALGSVTLFNGTSVSFPLIAVSIGAALLYHRFALLRILEIHQAKPAMLDDEPIVGAFGHVQRALDPVGTVYVRGESWTARADKDIPAGTPIVVVEREGLTLYVEAVKQKRELVEEN